MAKYLHIADFGIMNLVMSKLSVTPGMILAQNTVKIDVFSIHFPFFQNFEKYRFSQYFGLLFFGGLLVHGLAIVFCANMFFFEKSNFVQGDYFSLIKRIVL